MTKFRYFVLTAIVLNLQVATAAEDIWYKCLPANPNPEFTEMSVSYEWPGKFFLTVVSDQGKVRYPVLDYNDMDYIGFLSLEENFNLEIDTIGNEKSSDAVFFRGGDSFKGIKMTCEYLLK